MFEHTHRTHEAQGVVEYSIILLLVALVVIGAVQVLGSTVVEMFQAAADSFP